MRHWWLAAWLPFLLWACSSRSDAGPPQSGRLITKKAAAAIKRAAAPPPAAPASADRPAPPPVNPEQVLLALPGARLLPEDFDIGPLGDGLGGSRQQRLARATAVRFLAGLSGGKVPAAELLPERREELERSLQYYLDRRLVPARYRLGPLIELEDGSLRCRVRLFGEPGGGSGELYLSPAESRWYVSDVQVGLAALASPAPRREEKYVPTEVP